MSVGTAGFWICAWAVTFTLPYLFDEDQANLGPMVGWIYAGGGVISVVSNFLRLSSAGNLDIDSVFALSGIRLLLYS